MDLHLHGKRALVCGASRGLGFGCAEALAREGVAVTLVARRQEDLDQARAKIEALGSAPVQIVAADIATAEGRAAALGVCPTPEILVTNAGGPKPGDFRNFTREDWIAALDANMLSAIDLIKSTIDAMIAARFGRIVNITSGAVKSPIGVLGLSNGARAGLTGFVGGLAREVAAHNVTINNLLPGQFDTERLKTTHAAVAAARGMETEAYRKAAIGIIPAQRFGDPSEFGAVCAFLCSTQASFITGQNILLDGGQFPGLL